MPLDPQARRFLRLVAAGAPAGGAMDVDARRRSLLDLARLFDLTPEAEVTAEPLVLELAGRTLRARLYRPPPTDAPRGLVLFLHGGGWIAGDLQTHAGVASTLARVSGAAVLALDYRRAPEHPFPAALEDAVAALAWAQAYAPCIGVAAHAVALAGDSAGGARAAGATLAALAGGAQPPGRLALLCPILQMRPRFESRRLYGEDYFMNAGQLASEQALYLAKSGAADDWRASPGLAQALAGFPPTTLQLAEFDPFRDEALDFATRLAQAGTAVRTTVHPGLIHYSYALRRAIPAGRAMVEAAALSLRPG